MLSLNSRRQPKEEVALTITTSTFVRVLFLILGTIAILAAVRQAAHGIFLIFTAIFLALALNSPVHWVADHLPGKKKGSRALSTSISFLLVIILLGAFIASLVPPLVRQTQTFINNAPTLVQSVRNQEGPLGEIVRKYKLQSEVEQFSDQLQDRLKNVSGTALTTASHVGSSVFSLLAVLVMTFMMLVEGPYWIRFFKRLVPRNRKDDADRLLNDMYSVVKGFVNGQLLLAVIAALLISPVLFIMHVSYPIALVVVIFVCGLIPMIGHTIGAVLVTAVALFESPTAALVVLAWYITYQQIENYFVQPKVQANSTNLSPLLVFASVIVGVSFNGLIGGLVAIPLAGCARILVLYWLEERKLISEAELADATKQPEI